VPELCRYQLKDNAVEDAAMVGAKRLLWLSAVDWSVLLGSAAVCACLTLFGV
jgi:hypothetical protein